MVYQNKVVAVVKHNDKVLREDNGVVYIPFGAEYSVLIKNLDSVRIKFKIHIDGEDGTGWIICEPNSSVNMERFLKNGNLTSGNRFKFIERTEEIENHRGIGAEDGLIRIEYQREIQNYTLANTWHCNDYTPWTPNPWSSPKPYWGDNLLRCSSLNSQNSQMSLNTSTNVCNTATASNDQGITVPGSISDQTFVNGSYFVTGTSEYITIQLKGGKKPTTVNDYRNCKTCGRRSNYLQKFCGNCGTSLNIV